MAKVLGLLGSSHVGERAAAGLQAERIRLAMNTSWQALLNVHEVTHEYVPPARRFDPADAHPVELLARCSSVLSPWERAFLDGIGRRHRISAKQSDCLRRIRRRCAAWWATTGSGS
ncbi:hypothetical protein KX816_10075 [Sphingosinicellaceae bacterium]|nr:hypothetical protein KX816_10075 [Sphingosinicellaceae bacterium]